MTERINLPDSLHLITYDVRGIRIDNGQEKKTRQTGIVTQTHQLLGELAVLRSDLMLSVTQTGGEIEPGYNLLTPEGQTVFAQGIDTASPLFYKDDGSGLVDRKLVDLYYEEEIYNPDNPVYHSLAEQYVSVIRNANSPNLLVQNANPLVSILKAEEFGYLDDITAGQLNITATIHDIEGYEERLGYVCKMLDQTRMNVKLVAISEFVKNQLIAIGIAEEKVIKVPNGIDIQAFQHRLEEVRTQNLFEDVRQRNSLPENKKMILVSARRVEHKGHMDIVKAIDTLVKSGEFKDMYIAFTGCNMTDAQGKELEIRVRERISQLGLEDTIFLLDTLTDDEILACYGNAYLSLLASTEPEGFAYSNIEAMLAGVPVITARMGGPLDYIENGITGLFIEPFDPGSIVEAINSVHKDPTLYTKLSNEGKAKAEGYASENMAKGFVHAISLGDPKLAIHIHPRSAFQKIGEGLHTTVYRHQPSNGSVVQIFKEDRDELTAKNISQEYNYLLEAFTDMPNLIPTQRMILPHAGATLHEVVVVKSEVYSNPNKNTLCKVTKEELGQSTLEQLSKFVAIIKSLFTYESLDPDLQSLGARIPDIVDPEFANLIIDLNGDLRLVDTNRLINVTFLQDFKLDLEKNRISPIIFRRLMFMEAKFLGRSREELQRDSFYTRYMEPEDFAVLFAQSESVGEHI